MAIQNSIILLFLTSILYAGGSTVFTLGGEKAPNTLIIKYKNKKNNVFSNTANNVATTRSYIKTAIDVERVKKLSDKKIKIDSVKLKSHTDVDKTIEEIEQLNDVEYVEPDYWLKVGEINEDINALIQELFDNNNWGLLNIEVDKAWATTTGSPTVIVAVIDSGVDYEHIGLNENMWINSSEDINGDGTCDSEDMDGIDQDNNGYIDDCRGWNFVHENNDPSDDLGHGTHVAGIIGAAGESEAFGVNRSIRLMPIKFIAGDGYGKTSDAIESIVYSIDNGARILNNSWGGGAYSRSLKEVIEYSYQKNTLFIAAAGNEGENNDDIPHYPSNYSVANVLAVGASNAYNDLPYFSNYGKDSVDLLAPGNIIYSTVPNDNYAFYSGTSMATPFVAGVAALVLAIHPELSAYDLKRVLMESADQYPFLTHELVTGGRINANKALALADTGLSPNPLYPMTSQLVDPHERKHEVTSAVGCGRVELKAGRSKSDNLMLIIVIFLPVFMVIMRKTRNKAYAKLGRYFLRYF